MFKPWLNFGDCGVITLDSRETESAGMDKLTKALKKFGDAIKVFNFGCIKGKYCVRKMHFFIAQDWKTLRDMHKYV